MDPITAAIVAAISAGAVGGITDVGKKGIADAYDALKSLLKKKFGSRSDLVQAIDKLEANPSSRANKGGLEDEIEKVRAAQDPELLQAVQHLQYLLQNRGQLGQTALGSGNVQSLGGRDSVVVGERGKAHIGDVHHRRTHPWFPIILTVVILLIILGIVFSALASLSAFQGFTKFMDGAPSNPFAGPGGSISQFCNGLGSGNWQGAYSAFSSKYRNSVSPSNFENNWQSHSGAQWRCVYNVSTQNDNTAQATLSLHDQFGTATDTYTVSLINEDGAWKIDDIHP